MTTTNEAALLPCPFCGKPPKLDIHYCDDTTNIPDPICDVEFVVVRCAICGISKQKQYRSDAVFWWNKRANLPSDPAQRGDGCVCQDQHRRGYCTEPGCQYAAPPAPAGEPVAWFAEYDGHLDTTIYRDTMERWQALGCKITPLYKSPWCSGQMSSDEAELLRHRQIEAAKAAITRCPSFADFTSPPSMCALDMAKAAVDAIASLRSPETWHRALSDREPDYGQYANGGPAERPHYPGATAEDE